MRGLAVLAVIANHLSDKLLPNGYLGVDIFFVISGYVITLSLANRRMENIWDFAAEFFKRRIKRLAPALFTCVFVTTIAICLFNYQTASFINTGALSLIGASNIYLYKLSTNYFAEAARLNPFTQTWSLGVEEQFYLIYPWLAWIFWLKRKSQKNTPRQYLLLLIVITVASLGIYLFLITKDPNAAYFLLPSRLWELALGCILFLCEERRYIRDENLMSLGSAALPLLVALFVIPGINQAALTILSVATTALIILLPRNSITHSLLKIKPLIYVGLASYSLYLWHWSVLSISHWTIGIHWWTIPIQVALIGCTGFASYHSIEKKTRHASWEASFPFFFSSYVLFIIFLTSILSWLGRPYSRLFLGMKECNPQGLTTCKPKAEPHAALTPYISGTTINPDSCILATETQNFSEAIINQCSINTAKDIRKRMYLIGDSIAGNFSPILGHYFANKQAMPVVLVKYACRLESPSQQSLQNHRGRSSCDVANAQRWQYLESHVNPGDIILIASDNTTLTPSLRDSYQRLAALTTEKQAQTIAATPVPKDIFPKEADETIQKCINSSSQWFNRGARNECTRSYSISLEKHLNASKEFTAFLESLEATYSHFNVWDVSKAICQEDICASHKKGIRMYSDSKHLSIPGTLEFLLPSFQKLAREQAIGI